LISHQEHEAWEVLLACQGQLRVTPTGHLIGIDMDAVLKIGAARSCDLAVLSELLPAAETGLVEALCSDRSSGMCRRPRSVPRERPDALAPPSRGIFPTLEAEAYLQECLDRQPDRILA
jgi:hypothetical protein